MSKTRYISDYMEGERVNEVFMVTNKQLGTSKRGDHFLSLKLSDKSGDLDGKKWETSENEYDKIREGGFYLIKGTIQSFQGVLQVRIDSVSVPSESFDVADFMKSSPRNLEEMETELKDFIDSVKDENCSKLLKYFFDNPSIYKKFIEAPAAKSMHHAYISGLIEHTIDVCKIGDSLAKVYPFVNRDILIMGCLIHDIAKIKEYDYKGGIEFTPQGHMLGHLVMGAMMIRDACIDLKLDNIFTMHTEHMILSHHGKLEYGSPKRPKSLEAIILHEADNISAEVAQFMDVVDDGTNDMFTRNNRTIFERRLFKNYINEYFEEEREKEKDQDFDDFLEFFNSK